MTSNEQKEFSIDYTQIELRMLTLTASNTQNVFTYTAQDEAGCQRDKVLKFGLAYGASPTQSIRDVNIDVEPIPLRCPLIEDA
jgi:hypothetical protein